MPNGNGNGGKVKIKTNASDFTNGVQYEVNTKQLCDAYKVPLKRTYLAVDNTGKDRELEEKDVQEVQIIPGAL